ncbi:hypothetical protein LEP1GSC199_0427 [Leptospira vanthielii serovar Holland str. Waz Holland = ATCC 700522]|uniref:Uncharacterized protein n=1 Tax=Leptospira vanthielii serovar Holland str. Waz Holland = ATCC 700522 TaxID=1218591 RepID=N1W323_9LEPT|nr:hypothetical protein LEP1GSC199_0119 [Leptospira vanthielii serovar Holland str. Waz Holland = ATCC 700522]EMY71096.1 hypothetical protein LEP1GSC199_0427 [Leptospira vanthielii serovar Holland str. Waz Holland = ATCC 700522]
MSVIRFAYRKGRSSSPSAHSRLQATGFMNRKDPCGKNQSNFKT